MAEQRRKEIGVRKVPGDSEETCSRVDKNANIAIRTILTGGIIFLAGYL